MQATPVSGKMAEGRQLPSSETSTTQSIDQNVEGLLRRIAEFVLRKWITEKEESYFVMLLQRDLGTSKHNAAVKYVRKKLDEIEMKARSSSTIMKKTVRFSEPSSTSKNDDKMIESNFETSASKMICRNKDVNVIHIIDRFTASRLNLNSDQVSNLFVEMCFFARLGFLQPPCCLYCSFQRCSTNQKTMDLIPPGEATECHRYVVWRKDAKVLLSRNTLAGNLLLIRCCDAQKLIFGEEVISLRSIWRWDNMTKAMIEN
jgi:hypothetical protein